MPYQASPIYLMELSKGGYTPIRQVLSRPRKPKVRSDKKFYFSARLVNSSTGKVYRIYQFWYTWSGVMGFLITTDSP